jgi:hypothetical protein
MTLKEWANKSIPVPDDVADLKHHDGVTKDIIDTILFADAFVKDRMCKFASAFDRSYESLYDLWEFVRQNITYIADEEGRELVKDPTILWKDRSGDCKSFSLFIGSVLKCLQILYKYRFASYKGNDPTHVYVIATLNGREVILDATIDRFDSEVSYNKKWDKMTKIYHLHGAPAIHTGRNKPSPTERLADAPRIGTAKPNIDYSGMTEGQLTLVLLDEQLKILKNYYGDPDGVYQKARNIIYNTAKDPHRISGHDGYIDPSLYNLMPYIEYAMERSKPAGIANAHIGDFASDRDRLLAECKHITNELRKTIPPTCGITPMKSCLDARKAAGAYQAKKLDGTKISREELNKLYADCQDQVFFMDLYNKYLEGSSPHVLYEFLDPSTVTGTANFKANNHRLANSSMARYSKLDRTNIVLWERNGIMRASAAKGLIDISPEAFIAEWRKVKSNSIGDPITLGTILLAAIAFASKMLDLLLTKKASFASEVRGYGSEEFGPQEGDFENSSGSGFDFKSLLIPAGALALGGIILYND